MGKLLTGFSQVQDPSAVPGLSDDTDDSQGTLHQSSKPLSASTSAAHESLRPSSALSPAPHPSPTQLLLPALDPKATPLDPPPQSLAESFSAGIPDGGPSAQSGYPSQNADASSDVPIPDHVHDLRPCTSPVRQTLPSHILEAAPHRLSNGSTHASPTTQRRRAAKTLRMPNNTPLASTAATAAAAEYVMRSSSAMHKLPMMTVPEKPKRYKLSPLEEFTASPEGLAKPASVRWPASAGDLLKHAAPPMTSPGRPAPFVEAYRIAPAHGSSLPAAPAMSTDGDPQSSRPVASLPNPFDPNNNFSQGSLRHYAHSAGLGVAASESDAQDLINEAQTASGGLTDDQFQIPARPQNLFMTSSQSMQAAEVSSAQYASRLKQQISLPYQLEGQMPDENAIDLCEDDAMLDTAVLADCQDRQAQILYDETLARQMDVETRAGMQQLNVSMLSPHLHVVSQAVYLLLKA